MSNRMCIAAATALLLHPALLRAQPPAPIDPTLFSFPGSVANPPSAVSAGLALADRWLGEEPFSNPAAPPQARVVFSPAILRSSRQDLRANNRNYDETPAFFDGAGLAVGIPVGWSLGLWVYAFRPLARFEDNAFTRGTIADPGGPSAVIRSHSTVHESRAGLAVSVSTFGLRLGAALEGTRRDDEYRTIEQSGSPEAGERSATLKASVPGGQLGVRYDRGDSGARHLSLGAGVRFLPALRVKGSTRYELAIGDSSGSVAATRAAGWEGGISARYNLTREFGALAALGGRTAQECDGFGVTSGAGFEWKLGGEYHDPSLPWTARFGFGQERQRQVPESRAGLVGLGLGFDLEGVVLDLGAVRRSVSRQGEPASYDDRIVISALVDF